MKSSFQQAILLALLLLVALVGVEAKLLAGPITPDPFKSFKHIRNRKETVFNVLSFGAKPGGKIDNTQVTVKKDPLNYAQVDFCYCFNKALNEFVLQSFMKTWVAACHSKGAARVVIPSGTFLINQIAFAGPCTSISPIVVQIDATLKGGVDVSEYVSDEWILLEKINGLLLTGRGTLDGQGSAVWKYNDCGMNPTCQKLPVVSS